MLPGHSLGAEGGVTLGPRQLSHRGGIRGDVVLLWEGEVAFLLPGVELDSFKEIFHLESRTRTRSGDTILKHKI